MKTIAIAIDGPAGAGKSTIAKLVANKLNIHYLDTGAMYRAVALKVLKEGLDPSNHEEVISVLPSTHIGVTYQYGLQRVYLDGEDVTHLLRQPEVAKAASEVAVIPEVRMKLVELQRSIAQNYSVVVDGRDIGTFVLPNADKKFYLTATLEERSRRRWLEMREKGYDQSLEEVKKELEARDKNDMSRAFAPLRKAEDAILIDTTGKSIEQVANEVCGYLRDISADGR